MERYRDAMEMAEVYRARAHERAFERRAARTRRAKRLAGTLFALTGAGLMLSLFLYPQLMSDVVAWSHGTDVPAALRPVDKPDDMHVRSMPSSVVPVRRGGGAFGN
ncbi:MAG: hypothetical protein AAFY75_07340 [Pseudomonadota bacterium]